MLRNFVLAIALVATPALAHATEWTVDPAHSVASFTVKHMMVSTVRGEFGKMTGTRRGPSPTTPTRTSTSPSTRRRSTPASRSATNT